MNHNIKWRVIHKATIRGILNYVLYNTKQIKIIKCRLISYQQSHKAIYLAHQKYFLEAQFQMSLVVTDICDNVHKKCSLSQHFFQVDESEEQNVGAC